jgi:glycosyltransferase involved in cell wall biosynthesis
VIKVLFVLPDLEYSGAGKQLMLLLKRLPKERFETIVCVVGRSGPLLGSIQNSRGRVESLKWHRLLDIKPVMRYRELARRFAPDLIHAWGKPAWWFACLAEPVSARPIIASVAEFKQRANARFGIFERWLLRRTRFLVASSAAETRSCITNGVSPHKIAEVQPAVEAPTSAELPQFDLPGLPARARIIACIGPLEAKKGYMDAVWAFDILKYLYHDLHLVIAGDGPDRPRLESFVHSDRSRVDVHFVRNLATVSVLLARAEVVWIPSHAARGVNVALEAMAFSRPVVASCVPELAELVANGKTGMLYPAGNKVALARHTRLLLDNEEKQKNLGDAARNHVEMQFTVESLAARYASLYEQAIGNIPLAGKSDTSCERRGLSAP